MPLSFFFFIAALTALISTHTTHAFGTSSSSFRKLSNFRLHSTIITKPPSDKTLIDPKDFIESNDHERRMNKLKDNNNFFELNDVNLVDIVSNNPDSTLSILLFKADWAGPCNNLKNTLLNDIMPKAADTVSFYSVDTDHNEISTQMFSVRSIPTIIMFRNGKIVSEIIGNVNKDMLREQIERHSLNM